MRAPALQVFNPSAVDDDLSEMASTLDEQLVRDAANLERLEAHQAEERAEWERLHSQLETAARAHAQVEGQPLSAPPTDWLVSRDAELGALASSQRRRAELGRELHRVALNRQLMLACYQSNERRVRSLLEEDADPLARTARGCTTLMMVADSPEGSGGAEQRPQQRLAELLRSVTGGQSDALSNSLHRARTAHGRVAPMAGVTALALACARGQTDVVHLLLRVSADPQMQVGPANMTPLMLCAQYGNENCMSKLLAEAPECYGCSRWRGTTVTTVAWRASSAGSSRGPTVTSARR